MGENERNESAPIDLREQLAAAFAAADSSETGAPADGAGAGEAPNTAEMSNAEQQAAPAEAQQADVTANAPEAAAVSPAAEGGTAQAGGNTVGAAQTDQTSMALQMASRATQALRQMQEENAKLRAAMEQQTTLARDAAQAAVENNAPKQPQMPVFDASGWSYMDDEARNKASADFTAAMAEYVRSQMENEIAPIKASFEEQREAAAKAAAIGSLSGNSRMEGFSDALPQIERILDKTPSLAAEKNPELRYALGYLLKRGYDAMNAPAAKKSAADMARDAMSDPEVMRLIEAERARSASERNAAAVPQAASSGTSSAPATPQARPQNLGEAKELLRRSFGL